MVPEMLRLQKIMRKHFDNAVKLRKKSKISFISSFGADILLQQQLSDNTGTKHDSGSD